MKKTVLGQIVIKDHIFILLNLLKNHKAKNLSPFVAFIDAEKAFDRVNRHLMLYKLLKVGITGKVYSIIKKNIYISYVNAVLI